MRGEIGKFAFIKWVDKSKLTSTPTKKICELRFVVSVN